MTEENGDKEIVQVDGEEIIGLILEDMKRDDQIMNELSGSILARIKADLVPSHLKVEMGPISFEIIGVVDGGVEHMGKIATKNIKSLLRFADENDTVRAALNGETEIYECEDEIEDVMVQ